MVVENEICCLGHISTEISASVHGPGQQDHILACSLDKFVGRDPASDQKIRRKREVFFTQERGTRDVVSKHTIF